AVCGDPEKLVQTMNTLFLNVLRKKKMMTCCVGLVDTCDSTLRLINAGHPWPLQVRGGCAEYLKSVGMPLGSAKRWKAGEVTWRLDPGDVVFLYSDGLVEARAGNDVLGFSRLSESLPQLLRSEPRETIAAFWSWFDHMAPESPPADDVSVLVIQRQPASGEVRA
ncbi:MAG TPA: PP2C family protein-serine/threonine phosphatase, partial [Candidatus Ozemobacteraceae bacterium]|nr:PP2C family protein-serine/threonine phosphatase [Candidatus Ozemobacteraceae bacterium]